MQENSGTNGYPLSLQTDQAELLLEASFQYCEEP